MNRITSVPTEIKEWSPPCKDEKKKEAQMARYNCLTHSVLVQVAKSSDSCGDFRHWSHRYDFMPKVGLEKKKAYQCNTAIFGLQLSWWWKYWDLLISPVPVCVIWRNLIIPSLSEVSTGSRSTCTPVWAYVARVFFLNNSEDKPSVQISTPPHTCTHIDIWVPNVSWGTFKRFQENAKSSIVWPK